jgi:hypothetical protein
VRIRLSVPLLVAGAAIVLGAVAGTRAQDPPPAPAQPIPFSHRIHAGTLELACETCHPGSNQGDRMTIVRPSTCMQCHASVQTDSPSIQQLAERAKTDQPLPWVRVYQIPSFVQFSHAAHLKAGGSCQECHGPVIERDQLFRETDLTMTGCMDCHTTKGASLECELCHDAL